MRAADLKTAQARVDEREQYRRLLQRVVSGDALRIVLGAGDKASEIVMAADFLADMKRDIQGALSARIERLDAELAGLGVDG